MAQIIPDGLDLNRLWRKVQYTALGPEYWMYADQWYGKDGKGDTITVYVDKTGAY